MHPPEPAYPCYLPVLGEFNRMTPHEGPSASLPDDSGCPELAWFRGVSAAGHAHFSRPGLGSAGPCPALPGHVGHVQRRNARRGGMSIFRRQRWAFRDGVQPWTLPRGMSSGGAAGEGECPFFAGRVELCGTMSIPERERGACSPEVASVRGRKGSIGRSSKVQVV